MAERVLVAGVGMTPFAPLGGGQTAERLVAQAIRAALEDARVDFDLVDLVFVAQAHGESGSGERLLARHALGGVPVFSVVDGCVSGASALQLARQCILGGEAECVLALGVECMPADISSQAFFGLRDEPQPQADSADPLAFLQCRRHPAALFAAQRAWLLSRRLADESSFALVLDQARKRAQLNPDAVIDPACPRDGWMAPWLCSPANGAAAVLLCSPGFAARYRARAGVALLASVRGGDAAAEQEAACILDVLGRSATRRLALQACEQAGVGLQELDVVELHDQSVGDFMIYSAAIGLCREDELGRFVRQNANPQPGQPVVCPSGGLLGRGHAPGASGLAQIVELVRQLRREAGALQVAGARTALQHATAQGRAVSVSILQRC